MNIIITGGSNGIGREIALYLANNRACNVLITGRNEKSLADVADSAEKKNIRYFVSDLSKLHEAPQILCKGVSNIFKTVDILINNAGCLYLEKFVTTSDEQAREMMEINFFAPMLIINSVLPLMKKGSHIVNISSMGGFQGSVKFVGLSYYSASKAALACISECLAGELQEQDIRVNCLALGSVQTEMLADAFPGYKAPVTATEMGRFIGDFAIEGGRNFNGKVIPVSLTTP